MPKTITDIIPPSRRKAMEAKQGIDITPVTPPPPPLPPPVMNDSDEGPEEPPTSYPRPLRTGRKGFPWKYAIATLVVIVLAVGILHAFSGAKVEVTPVVNATAVSGEFAATSSAGDLSYELVTVSTVVSASVPAEGTEESDDPAQGTITVYNAQNKAQQLIKNTRFESPQGLIFRIRDSISVPPGSATNPGQLQVTVYADEGGEEYNVGPTSFTIPGLKGSETFDMVYARSTEAMTGGFSGMRASVSEATKTREYGEMKGSIDLELANALTGAVPEGYVLLPGASWTTYEPQPDGIASGTVTLNQKGTITAAVFPNEALAKAIAYRTVAAYDGQAVRLENVNGLSLASMSGSAPAGGDSSFSFTLSGNTNIKWVVDPARIAAAVAGKTRDAAQTVLMGFPEVEKAQMVLRPFWAGKFPDDPEKIKVNVVGEEE